MKKRIFAALIATAIILSLAGCGSQQPTPAPDTAKQTVSTTATTTDSEKDTEHTDKENSSTKETSSAEQSGTTEPSASETESTETKTQTQQTKPPAGTTEPETQTSQTASKETESRTEDTKPPQTTVTEPPKTEAPETTEPEVTTPTRPSAAEIEQLVVVYLNEHRNAQGAGSATALPGLTEVARFRAEQLITDFSHNSDPDACTVLKYGEFIDMTQYGFSESDNYYQGYDAEACAKGNWTGTAEDIARKIADGFRNSSGHWQYVGDSQYGYMAVGLTYDNHTAKWYCCVCVSSQNYGG